MMLGCGYVICQLYFIMCLCGCAIVFFTFKCPIILQVMLFNVYLSVISCYLMED